MKTMCKRLGLAAGMAMLGVALAQGDEPAAQAGESTVRQWRMTLENGDIVESAYASAPVRLDTAVGDLVFAPEELVRIEFPLLNLCAVDTVYGDRWYAVAQPKSLVRLVDQPETKAVLETVKSIEFLSSTSSVPAVSMAWTVELMNGSRVGLDLEPATAILQTESGRLVLPLERIRSLRQVVQEAGVEAVVEILPGGHGLRGRLSGPPLRGRDQGGRSLSLPWDVLSLLVPAGNQAPAVEKLVMKHDATCRRLDGTAVQGSLPVYWLTVKGKGGTWSLPTTALRQMRRNDDRSFTVQTTLGEWLTGILVPEGLPFGVEGETNVLSWADCRQVEWSNPPVEMPADHGSWRLKTGDILVARWTDEEPPAAAGAAAAPRVQGKESESAANLPVKTGGKWPVARFSVQQASSGKRLELAADAVEEVRAVAPEQMPPAVSPSGPSAMGSDEVFMPGGTFAMGRSHGEGEADEVPPVTLALEPFWIANTPVTVAQFAAFAAATRHVTDAERLPGAATWRQPGFPQRPEDPVVCVSWRDAVSYCNWRSAVAGWTPCYRAGRDEVVFVPGSGGYRLPLEAEWEYAARSGGQDHLYPWGDEAKKDAVARLANFQMPDLKADPWPWTSPVKTFLPSSAGLYDMGGNVWEWCQDIYREDAYLRMAHGEDLAARLNAVSGTVERRAMRGGSYHNPLPFLRCAARGFGVERMSVPRVGFRVVRNAEEAP